MENLKIYNSALEFVEQIYKLINNSNKLLKDFSLNDQLKRASVSVVANIAEGHFRTKKQSIHYLQISSGSTNEIVTLLKIVQRIYQIDTLELQNKYKILGKQINAYAKSF